MKLKKIFSMLILFISVFFYGNSSSQESITNVSSKKNAELKLKVTKLKSKEEKMYINREGKKIFYFFGNDGLVAGDFLNIVEKISDPKYLSKTFSNVSKNSSELKYSNQEENTNLKYGVEKGTTKNRVIIEYKNEPKNIFIEVYDRLRNLKKIIRNSYEEIEIRPILCEINSSNNEFVIDFNKNSEIIEELEKTGFKDRMEIFTFDKEGKTENLKYSIEKLEANEKMKLKIKASLKEENIYLASFDIKGKLERIYLLKDKKILEKNYSLMSSYFTWNQPVIDITKWNRKDKKTLKNMINSEFVYGTETLPNGIILPYIDIKMGTVLIPTEVAATTVTISNTNNINAPGQVLLANNKNENISGRLYIKSKSLGTKTPVKGENYQDILESTSSITYSANETKEGEIYLRIYDLPEKERSLFSPGKLKYIKAQNSISSVEILDGNTSIHKEALPEIEIVDIRDNLKDAIKIDKRTINLSEDIGVNIGDDIKWSRGEKYVDIKIAEISIDAIEDRISKLKNSYIEIETSNSVSNKSLESLEKLNSIQRYYLKVKTGVTEENRKITQDDEILGYSKVSGITKTNLISSFSADVIVRMDKESYITFKNTAGATAELKNADGTQATIKMVFNEDYPEQAVEVPYNSFKVIKSKNDLINNNIKIDSLIFFNEIKENKLNLIFDPAKNSTGDISVRGDLDLINGFHKNLIGNSVFDMEKGITSRTYSDVDTVELENMKGISNIRKTDAQFSKEGYKSIAFEARNMNFELKFWNNTTKVELVMSKGASTPQEGEIYGDFILKGINGEIYNKIALNLYSSTRTPAMTSDNLRIWRNYTISPEWGTEVEVLNTTTPSGSAPNLKDEGGLHSLANPFISFTGDTVYLEPIKGIGVQGIGSKALKLSTFNHKENFGTIINNKLQFDSLGKGNAKLELTLTKDFIESYFPLGQPSLTFRPVEVAEIVYGKGKRRIPISVRIQLRVYGDATSSYPVREVTNHIESKYYQTGLYDKTDTVIIKDITPGEEKDMAQITPTTVENGFSGVVPSLSGIKSFRGKNLKTDIKIIAPTTGLYNNAGVQIDDVLLTKTPGLFGIFTMSGGREQIKEHEIWIPKYSPISEIQSQASTIYSNSDGPREYERDFEILRHDVFDKNSTLEVVKSLGFIQILGRDKARADIMRKNSSTLNLAKLPDKIKLLASDSSGVQIDGFLSFSENSLVTEIEQKEGIDQGVGIYLIISAENSKKVVSGTKYTVTGEYSAGRVDENQITTENLLYYGLKTDNISSLGLNEYIYEPVFKMALNASIGQSSAVVINLDNASNRPILKAAGISKNIKVYKNLAKYSSDVKDYFNYMNLEVSGNIMPYNYTRAEFKNQNHTLRVTDKGTGKVFIGTLTPKGGKVNVESSLMNLTLEYSDDISVRDGFSGAHSLEVLNIGVNEYKYQKGELRLLLEHLDPVDNARVLEKDEIIIKTPEFKPRNWYYDEYLVKGLKESSIGKYKDQKGHEIIFELGTVGMLAGRAKDITQSEDDTKGVRIEYDKEITLEKVGDSTVKITGKIVLLDLKGNILPDESIIEGERVVGISVNNTQLGYEKNVSYTVKNLEIQNSNSVVNKPIRIGRNGQWEGLVNSITLEPSTIGIFGQFFKWNSSLVDITNWSAKEFKLSRKNTTFTAGIESLAGEQFPYIDINLGEIVIPISDPKEFGDSFQLKSTIDENVRGKVLIQNKNGVYIEGRLYFKSDLAIEEVPVKGKNNKNIEGSTSKVYFKGLKDKKATVHLRIYDSKVGEPSIFTEGITEYIQNRISDNTIEILSEGKVLYSDNTIPEVEFVDTRDSLKENVVFDKRVLDFTYKQGENSGEDIEWALANRFVDVRLMEMEINNFDDKVAKLKDPYIEIDAENNVSTSYLEVNGKKINPYRYFIRLETGKGAESDKITEGDYIMGYKKISTDIENGKVNNLKGDIIVRLLSEDYVKIRESGIKSLKFKKSDGTAPKVKLVLNSDYPDKVAETSLEDYTILTAENDKLGKVIDLKILLAMKEIKETTNNYVFDYEKNSSGNIGIRANSKAIDDELEVVRGSSVFDMSGELLSQSYSNTDQIDYSGISDIGNIKDSGAKFEVEGYKSISFTQVSTNIKYEIRFWNNTKKIEISMDKSMYNGSSSGELKGSFEIKNSSGKSKARVNLTLSSSMIDKELTAIVLRIRADQGVGSTIGTGSALIISDVFEYSPKWNTDIAKALTGSGSEPINIAIRNYKTYTGDTITVQAKDGVQGDGLTKENFTLSTPNAHIYGKVENGKLVLDSNGDGRANIQGEFTRDQINNIWRDNNDPLIPKLYVMEITYGNGKRKIPQWIQISHTNSPGTSSNYLHLESEIMDNNQDFRLGAIDGAKTEIRDENNILYISFNDLTATPNEIYPGNTTRSFRGKNINLEFIPTSKLIVNMRIKDIVLSAEKAELGNFKLIREDTNSRERISHKIIVPRYNPISESYSITSSLDTVTDGKGKLLNQKLEIVRDKLDDPTTTSGIVKSLGTVGLLGRDSIRGAIIKRNSTTMNKIKLPDRVSLQKVKAGVVLESINAKLSFDVANIVKEFEQIENKDQEKTIYLHIEKAEAEKLEPGVTYSIQGEYNGLRIQKDGVIGKNIAYIGLKTDKIDDLGLDEYIYDPLFQMNLQTEIAQDTSVKLFMSEDKPIIQSNGKNNLVRVYLSEAKYTTDISNPGDYSTLTMRGLLTPYEYNKPEYGKNHDMIIRLKGSSNSTKINFNSSSGGQGVLKTIAGDLYIGYSSDLGIQSGLVASNPLEILTIGMKTYNFRGGSFNFDIEHLDPTTGKNILSKESLTLEIPRFLPKKWYYNESDPSKIKMDINSNIKYIKGTDIIYPLGNVSLYSNRDVEITKGLDDPLGVRIQYDSEIELISEKSSGSSIKGKIVRVDKDGNILLHEEIFNTPSELALVIDTAQAGYKFNTKYIYDKGVINEVTENKLNKPIRIGRDANWEGLVKRIELSPFVNFKWNSPIVDLTNWKRKNITKNIQNKDFIYGEEIFLGETIPYVDINMGEVDMENNSIAQGLKLKSENGNILLNDKNGNNLEGRIYLKSDNTTVLDPVKDKSNNNILNSTKKVIFSNGKLKKSTVHLRIYENKAGEPLILTEGIIKYVKNRISDNTIEILSEGKVLYSDNTIPEVEFVDTRDSLKENVVFDKRVLDFTYKQGENSGEDIEWALTNRFVDVRLMEMEINNFNDKVAKLKDPYIEIDAENNVSTSYLEVNGEKINPYRYFIRLETGKGAESDKITEGDYIMGYKKISTDIENGKVNNLKGDIIVRLLSEDYMKIRESGIKSLKFKKSDGTAPKVKLVLNSDYPDKAAETSLEDYTILTAEDDKTKNVVNLKVLLAMREIKEADSNYIFDFTKNLTGDIGIRPNGKFINDEFLKLKGSSVFDMSGELLSQSYSNTDQIDYSGISDIENIKDSGAKFEVEGYKSISFTQVSTNIKYEIRFWNNTKKIEISMDKSMYNGSSSGELKGSFEIKSALGKTKAKVNLVLSSNMIDKDLTYIVLRIRPDQMGSGATAGNGSPLTISNIFEYSPKWNTEVAKADVGNYSEPIDVAIGGSFKTYAGDTVAIQAIDGPQENGLIKENFILTKSSRPYGRVENGRLILDNNGYGRARIQGEFTKEQVQKIWQDNNDALIPKLYVMEISYGNGKRKIAQWLQINHVSSPGTSSGYVEYHTELENSEQEFKLGGVKNAAQVWDENDLEIASFNESTDHPGTYPGSITKKFRDKNINFDFILTHKYILSMRVKDIVLTKEESDLGIFRLIRNDTLSYERAKHRIINSRYNPISESYSSLSSLDTTFDGKGKLLNQKLEIVRDKLDDPTTTSGIVKSLGTVGLLGRDSIRGAIIKRNSTTMNKIKLPDRVSLQKVKAGVVIESVNAQLSFDAVNIVKEFEQIENNDQEKTIYLHIEKAEAEKLEPGVTYSVQGEYNGLRIQKDGVTGKNIAYIGLKTDNIADLGLDEYIYDPLFQMNLQTEIAQDTSVKLFMSEDKPIIQSNGKNNLVRVYLSEAKYTTDISNPEDYSTLTMRGLLTPYEYNKPEYGENHDMIVRDIGSGNSVKISLNKNTGGQGVLKTVAGDIYIGYLKNPELQNGTVAANSLEILTIGMKEYNFRDGSLQIEIEHMDPANPINILSKESLTLDIPRFLPKKWYYNEENINKVKVETTGSARYSKGSETIYPIGNVGLYSNKDLEITKNHEDPLGIRIEYDENITLTEKENTNKSINGRIVAIDELGNILPKGHIYDQMVRLAVVIDTTQPNYSHATSYIYRGGNIDKIDSSKVNKIIRIGRGAHWEGLVKSIELKSISQGDLVLNYDFNYDRGTQLDFDKNGKLTAGSGAYLSIDGDFINNIPNTGKITIFKWLSAEKPYGEKLGEGNIVGGNLEKPLEITYKTPLKTSYTIKFNEITNDKLNLTLLYWDSGIFGDKLSIRVEDENGVTSIYKMTLKDFDNRSILNLEYDNSLIASGVIPDASLNSLYFGSILNPKSFSYTDMRSKIKTLNKLKITYYGKDANIHDTIAIVTSAQKDATLENIDMPTEKIVIEDITAHRVYKREIKDSAGAIMHQEGFTLEGYFNPITNKNIVDGRYRGSITLNIDIH